MSGLGLEPKMKCPNLRLSFSSLSRCVLAIALLAALCSGARAQDLDKVTISGRVADANGAVIPGATVVALLTATNVSRTINTDDDGRYRLIQLGPAATPCESPPLALPLRKKDLVVIAGQNVQLDITLTPQGVMVDPIVVSAATTPIVDTTRTVVGATVTTS